MTGTASSDARELRKIYKVNVFKVPTNRTGRRVWVDDRIFSNEAEKFQAVADKIVEWNKHGVPVLVGTRLDREVGKALRAAECGQDRAPDPQREESRDRGPDCFAGRPARARYRRHEHGRPWNRHQARRGRGGARACTSSAPSVTNRRIDRQLAGRCARQGDPGFCEFFVSLQDEILEAYGEKPAARLRARYRGMGELTSNPMRRLVFAAQAKKERQHFRDRKLLMIYEKQRGEMRFGTWGSTRCWS